MVSYFAYGSNLNQEDLDKWCKKRNRPLIDLKLKSPRPCVLRDYTLDFNYYSRSRGGGAANIEPSQGEYVEGVLFEMTKADMQTIDIKEGAPNSYRKIPVSVILKDNEKVDGVATYTVCDKCKTHFTAPTDEYLKIMLDGARAFGLSSAWIAKVNSIARPTT
ncbi:MAG: gamma-glutamylcyclotransferase family protein [Candidatus Bathyarchaeia archaeon]|jgi:hypothetical protein